MLRASRAAARGSLARAAAAVASWASADGATNNIRKHASGTTARVRITGAPDRGLHVSVRNRQPIPAHAGPALPGSGAGLLGLEERVTLAGGTLVHGPDGSGDFVVDAELQW